MTAFVLIALCMAVLLGGHAVAQLRRLRFELSRLDVDPAAEPRVFPASMIPVRLLPEIERGRYEHAAMALLLLTSYAPDMAAARARLAGALRLHESAYVIGSSTILVWLWGADDVGTVAAAARLGECMLGEGARVADAGVVLVPSSGEIRIDQLVTIARDRSRPVQDFSDWARSTSTT